MPRPLVNRKTAGPQQPAAWFAPAENTGGETTGRQELETEVLRLRAEVERLRARNVRQHAPSIWGALMLCGGALIFAILALAMHG